MEMQKVEVTMMKRLAIEFAGTFLMMFIAGTAIIGQTLLAELAIGVGLALAIRFGAEISGSFFNPLVSLVLWRRGKVPLSHFPLLTVVQLVAALAAAWLVSMIQGAALDAYIRSAYDKVANGSAHLPPWYTVFFAEFIPSLVLAWVIILFTQKEKSISVDFGLCIGFILGVVTCGNFHGGLLNPALAAGKCFIGLKSWDNLLLYWPAQFAAAFLATEIFQRTHPKAPHAVEIHPVELKGDPTGSELPAPDSKLE